MAMEKLYTERDCHTRAITAVGYHQARREIMLGCEDGIVKTLEADTGNLVNVFKDHKGWVTDFVYWPEPKIVLSSSNDGMLLAWGAGAVVSDKILIGQPVYCMVLCLRRKQLICGLCGSLRVYGLDEERASGHYIGLQVKFIAKEHTDIVKCIAYQDPRIYSAGFDQRFIVYESSYTGALKPLAVNSMAHDASISSLILVKDNESNMWCVTGSYDKTVKIWSADGKLVHKLDGFIGIVTSLCYIHRTRTLWIAGGMANAYLYDPKTGDNVSDFIGTFEPQSGKESNPLQLLKFFPESNQVVATTSRRNLVVWKYNVSGCITALKCSIPVDSIAYTRKEPILIFTGDSDGTLTRWERMQLNHLMYSKDLIPLSDTRKAKRRQQKDKEKAEKSENPKENKDVENAKVKEAKPKYEAKTHYDYNKPIVTRVTKQKSDTSISRMVFIEELDKLVVACEDSNIYVWGFDEDAVKVLKRLEPAVNNFRKLPKHFDILLQSSSQVGSDYQTGNNMDDSVTNRVAGFVCKHVLINHQSSVTSLAVVRVEEGDGKGIYLVSGGWDRRICVWDLEAGVLKDVFRNQSTPSTSFQSNERIELACDGIINDIAYSPIRNEIAYATSDRMVYIRKFCTRGAEMVLLNTLQGHEGEVVCVKWNPVHKKWITGSEDGTVRIWTADGMNECEQVLVTQGAVSSLCIDSLNGAIIAGVQNIIRVYDSDLYRLVQTNLGHTDTVKSIQHIPERNQYVSTSWDKTVRIWNAWKPSGKKVKPEQVNAIPSNGSMNSTGSSRSGNNSAVPEADKLNFRKVNEQMGGGESWHVNEDQLIISAEGIEKIDQTVENVSN